MKKISAKAVMRDLRTFASPTKAKASAWFFRTGKGHYGYGDVFLGVTTPEQRLVAQKFFNLPLTEIKKLLVSRYHEHRLTALFILVSQFKQADAHAQKRIANFYLKNLSRVNNWDLVDSSAPYILGTYLIDKPRDILYKLVTSQNIWHRRVAIISTLRFIKEKDFDDTLQLAEMLLSDSHDLVHKAVGWSLREVGKKSELTLKRFLKKHLRSIPRTSLRYAIERFPEGERKKFLRNKI